MKTENKERYVQNIKLFMRMGGFMDFIEDKKSEKHGLTFELLEKSTHKYDELSREEKKLLNENIRNWMKSKQTTLEKYNERLMSSLGYNFA